MKKIITAILAVAAILLTIVLSVTMAGIYPLALLAIVLVLYAAWKWGE